MKPFFSGLLALAFALVVPLAPAATGFEFQDNDRVVLLGGTLMEREQKFGYLETALTLAAGEAKHVSFRNLGWSGDTVFGHARSYFGPPKEGLERLSRHLEQIKPTVLITCYGADLPFEGLQTLPEFITGYRELLDLARAKSPNVRVVIIAPPPLENLGAPLPDLTSANQKLEAVRNALKEFASKQAATFVDSFELMGGTSKQRPAQPLTDNGLHYGDVGYRLWAGKVTEGMGLGTAKAGAELANPLRQTVIKKDQLFFNRWRPANETYLYGFRKHEQGQNAAEIEKFDPLIAAEDQKIHEQKVAILQAVKKLP
ncbi:MAG TPA: SGNH/GDSL hydrolase family protein [Verrucomicrobium sp.]|nr:SGNH/GDSL hydrolase family protein [Verrucomicrobium sp.]